MNLWPVRSGPPPGKNLISNDFGLYADVGSVTRGEEEEESCFFLTILRLFLFSIRESLMIGADFVEGKVD